MHNKQVVKITNLKLQRLKLTENTSEIQKKKKEKQKSDFVKININFFFIDL